MNNIFGFVLISALAVYGVICIIFDLFSYSVLERDGCVFVADAQRRNGADMLRFALQLGFKNVIIINSEEVGTEGGAERVILAACGSEEPVQCIISRLEKL